jgi:hypothetical protein
MGRPRVTACAAGMSLFFYRQCEKNLLFLKKLPGVNQQQ